MDVLRRFLPLTSDIPSHDTLNDVSNAIEGELFATCFTRWVSSLDESQASPGTGPEVVAVGRKTSRRTHDRARDRNPLHLVSAWVSGQRLMLGQQACAAKPNEITAVSLLLDRLAKAEVRDRIVAHGGRSGLGPRAGTAGQGRPRRGCSV